MTGALARVGPEAFDGDRLLRPGAVVVAFLADWCPFCRSFEPKLEQLVGSHRWEAIVADVTSEDSPLWERFEVKIVPTVVVYRDGRAVGRFDGRWMRGLTDGDLAGIAEAAGP